MPPKKAKPGAKATPAQAKAEDAPATVTNAKGKEFETTAAAGRPRRASHAAEAAAPVTKAPVKKGTGRLMNVLLIIKRANVMKLLQLPGSAVALRRLLLKMKLSRRLRVVDRPRRLLRTHRQRRRSAAALRRLLLKTKQSRRLSVADRPRRLLRKHRQRRRNAAVLPRRPRLLWSTKKNT